MGLAGVLADVPTSRRAHVFSATSLCRHSCTSDTSASASPTSSVPSPCIPDSSGCARSPVEPTLPSASRLVQALGFPSKDQVPGGACDRIGGGNTAKAIVQTRYGSPDVFELREVE